MEESIKCDDDPTHTIQIIMNDECFNCATCFKLWSGVMDEEGLGTDVLEYLTI